MRKDAKDILKDLAKPWNVQVHSTAALAGSVADAAARDDEQRREEDREPLRRKPGLAGISGSGCGTSIRLTPWELLHALGRAVVLARQGAGRGLAEHWSSLKYCQALTGGDGHYMALSPEGLNPRRHYKTVQSSELGIGFAVALAERMLRKRYPQHSVSVIDADIALQAGWALVGKDVKRRDWIRLRPDFLLEAWKPGEPSKIIPVACRGTHAKTSYVYTQLAGASAQVEAFHVGPWNQTPSLVVSTELLGQGGITMHALYAEGSSALTPAPGEPEADADQPLHDLNIYPEVRLPAAEGEEEPRDGGFQVRPEHYAWFRRAVVRAGVAGLMAFSGGGDLTAQYLTKRQGSDHFEGFVHAGTGIVQDATAVIRGTTFLGTDHVFRLNGTRVEVAEGLFRLLAKGACGGVPP
ncbi:hypothetical protein RKE29_23695 [Streptomyces sp. B1866]|uniref:hypothetical protein n=1 Tax=Streptomyces sp. B1866 TaxID=3075431 RepID=UPI00288E0A40|nr:hypothetical protein [Streptomyces sp. B1866]MDT3399609.1 hypothetical protein [Streptomyces sp. B1866]